MPKNQSLPTDHNANLEHERLTSLINSMADGVIATDQHGKIMMYNGAALNILDVNTPMEGKFIHRVLELIDTNNKAVDVKKLVLGTKLSQSSRDLRLAYPDSSEINLYLSVAPVQLSYGERGDHGFVILLRDITREKSLEEERDEFISVVSHELRTPITIAEGNIGNALYIVERKGNSKEIQDALTQAHEQILFLGGLINDLSTLSRAERGKLSVDIEPINTHELIEELAHNYAPQAEAKNLTLQTDLDPGLEVLHSSKLYVREILQNFITNSIKYTETGGITIGAQPRPGGVQFSITDTGIGISKSDQQKVFDKFFRSEDYRTRKTSGTGLGLYVTMKLAHLLHAQIELESELNKGSTFLIWIPDLARSGKPQSPPTTT